MTTIERIKAVAKMRGYNLTKVNDLANLGKNTIYSWKTKEPSFNNLSAVADVLHVSVEYLLGNTDEMNPKSTNKPATDLSTDDVFFFEGQEVDEDTMEYIRETLRRIKKNN